MSKKYPDVTVAQLYDEHLAEGVGDRIWEELQDAARNVALRRIPIDSGLTKPERGAKPPSVLPTDEPLPATSDLVNDFFECWLETDANKILFPHRKRYWWELEEEDGQKVRKYHWALVTALEAGLKSDDYTQFRRVIFTLFRQTPGRLARGRRNPPDEHIPRLWKRAKRVLENPPFDKVGDRYFYATGYREQVRNPTGDELKDLAAQAMQEKEEMPEPDALAARTKRRFEPGPRISRSDPMTGEAKRAREVYSTPKLEELVTFLLERRPGLREQDFREILGQMLQSGLITSLDDGSEYEEAADPRRKPPELVVVAEKYLEEFMEGLTDRDERILRGFFDGELKQDTARALDVTAAPYRKHRGRLMARLEDLLEGASAEEQDEFARLLQEAIHSRSSTSEGRDG